MSYRRILAPVLALGLVLTGLMFALSNTIVPSFFRLAERTVDSDVVTLLVNQLDTGQPFVIREQDLVIYADSARAVPADRAGGGATCRCASASSWRASRWASSTATATSSRTPPPSAPSWRCTATATPTTPGSSSPCRGVVRYDPATGGLGRVESLMSRPIRVPSPLRDNPKFFSAGDLAELWANPQQFDQVADIMRRLAGALATGEPPRALVQNRDRAVLHGVLSGDRYVLSAPIIREQGELLRLRSKGKQPVRVELFTGGETRGEPARVYLAESGVLKVRTGGLSAEPTIDLELENVEVIGRPDGPSGGDRLIPIRQLRWPGSIFEGDPEQMSPEALREMAQRPAYADSPQVTEVGFTLRDKIESLRRRITGQRHERAASAVSCMLLLLLGAVLSIRLRGQTPLVVYFWSFLLAIVTIVITSSGQNVAGATATPLPLGLAVLWSGNALLLVVVLSVYRKLARH